MNKKIAFIILCLGSWAMAQSPGQQEVDQRVQNQDNRMQQGVNNGTMSPERAQHIENKDARVENRVNSGKESQAAANRQLNRNSRKIRRAKHNQ
jgi:hypothetical protein